MGFLSQMMEKGRGPRLWSDYRKKIYPVLQQVKAERLEPEVISELARIGNAARTEIKLMSVKGRKDFAWRLQLEGLSEIHSNVPLGLATWLTGAMIEATFVETAEATEFRNELDRLTIAIGEQAKASRVLGSEMRALNVNAATTEVPDATGTLREPGSAKGLGVPGNSPQGAAKQTQIRNSHVSSSINRAATEAQEENRRHAERIRKSLGLD